MMKTQIALASSVTLAAVAFGVAFTILTKSSIPPPPQPSFEQRWNMMMEDIYQSQENLRRTGHIYYDAKAIRTERICTKKWCNPHPN